MYKILVTSTYAVHWGSGAGCSCHTLVIEFPTTQEAEEARRAINVKSPTEENTREFSQEAVALYRTEVE